jgi:hypothetical protein
MLKRFSVIKKMSSVINDMGTVSEQEIPAYYYIHELSCLPGDGEL